LTFEQFAPSFQILETGMNRAELTEHEWQTFYELLKVHPRIYIRSPEKCRLFLNAIVWFSRSGSQWRLLPTSFGKWNSVFKRFSRWCQLGIWKYLFEECSQCPDLQQVLIDSTVVRAHACAAGAVGSNQEDEALGRSKGGFTTKIHAVTDALGNPLSFILTGGQASDIGQADALLQLTPAGAKALLADKGYDSDAFVQAIVDRDMLAVIPPRCNRSNPRTCDWFVYKERHLIECFFGKIKHYRRIFSRFDKLAQNYMGFLHFAAALIWLR
jgi:transposase